MRGGLVFALHHWLMLAALMFAGQQAGAQMKGEYQLPEVVRAWSRTVSKFVLDGILAVSQRQIQILNMDALHASANRSSRVDS
jgi:hypothetical protein